MVVASGAWCRDWTVRRWGEEEKGRRRSGEGGWKGEGGAGVGGEKEGEWGMREAGAKGKTNRKGRKRRRIKRRDEDGAKSVCHFAFGLQRGGLVECLIIKTRET